MTDFIHITEEPLEVQKISDQVTDTSTGATSLFVGTTRDHFQGKKVLKLGMISHKMSLITIFGHKHKIKNIIKKFDIFHKKFQQPSILVYIWNKIANFESQLH